MPDGLGLPKVSVNVQARHGGQTLNSLYMVVGKKAFDGDLEMDG